MTREQIAEPIEFSSIDVAFISLTKVLEAGKSTSDSGWRGCALDKPQFEAGREQVGKKGVVRDKAVHLEVVERILAYASGIGFQILNLEFSPIKGPEGNIEYLVHLKNHEEGTACENMPVDPKAIVEQAHQAL